MRVRELTLADHDDALAIARGLRMWFTPRGLEQLRTDLRFQRGLVIEDDAVRGFLTWFVAEGAAHIGWMGVDVANRRQGHGRALVDALAASLARAGVGELRVDTLGDAVESAPYAETRAFYRGAGFEERARVAQDDPEWPERLTFARVVAPEARRTPAAAEVELRMLAPGDERAFTRHLAEHTAESGADGDPVFTPMLSLDEEDFERTAYQRLRTKLEEPGWFRVFGAFDDGALIGHVDLRGEDLEAARHRVHLGIGVSRAARGRGVGRALMQAALEFARARPELRWVDLYVFTHNTPAVSLYRSLGFVSVGRVEERFIVQGEPVGDLHMVLDLRHGREPTTTRGRSRSRHPRPQR